ncbi:4-hydroxy-3-methylbut-2-en-1-yl diphosphate synthase, partial [Xanthomonas perforans]|nr:4-hydroxy-3-methylbut-2-en-1-yl diphosphate synthase [Xanthomonas perforans]
MHDAVTRPTPPADATAWPRRINQAVKIGSVTVGGGHPVVVQSMTNTDT